MSTEYKTIRVAPVTPTLGADVYGADLSKPLDETQFAEIQRAWHENLVLFFREQPRLSPEQQIAFGKRFGPLHVHPLLPQLKGFPEIWELKVDPTTTKAPGEVWHSDVSFAELPPLGSVLQIHTRPPLGGDTLFSSTYAAYDRLSEKMKSFLQGLEAIHEGWSIPAFDKEGKPAGYTPIPKAQHPVIRTHPATGKHVLFVNRNFTKRIIGLTELESKALLQHLFDHVENSAFQVRLRWNTNDVAFWDNRCTQHSAVFDYFPHERQGHRVTIIGEKPVYKPSTRSAN